MVFAALIVAMSKMLRGWIRQLFEWYFCPTFRREIPNITSDPIPPSKPIHIRSEPIDIPVSRIDNHKDHIYDAVSLACGIQAHGGSVPLHLIKLVDKYNATVNNRIRFLREQYEAEAKVAQVEAEAANEEASQVMNDVDEAEEE